MTKPPIIFGLGAAKAGTSWVWEVLASHPAVTARAVKELHYFDTFDGAARERQLEGFARVRARLVRNDAAERRISDLERLCDVLRADRAGDAGYLGFVRGEGAALDVTPSYALLPEDRLRQMAGLFPGARFLYLVRDPVARLWSHIRMEVTRRMQPGADFDNRAKGMLRRITEDDGEPQIVKRGDYAAALTRMQVLPEVQVLVTEEMTVESVCAAAGLPVYEAAETRVHVGKERGMKPGMRDRAARFLKDQYSFMAEYLGRVPAAWQGNYERAFA